MKNIEAFQEKRRMILTWSCLYAIVCAFVKIKTHDTAINGLELIDNM